jgi:methylmalonyl-CoA mutase
MADAAPSEAPQGLHRPTHPVRFVTAASLFDGHDAAINIMRRLLQRQGVEVVHLGHNRSVDEVVTAAVQEDVQGVAISSYQGGHVEYFEYLVDRLRAAGRPDIQVYGGGGGVIVAEEIERLHASGVAHIFSPEDGQRLGLERMVNTMVADCDRPLVLEPGDSLDPLLADQEDKLRVAVLAVDPTRRKGGGALLGDRIRMNSITSDRVYFRSLATRGAVSELPDAVTDAVTACRAAGYDLILVETPGIGQGDAAVVGHVDVSLYVMTPEFGAASQLEKIDMLDFADAVAINKFERRGAEDARRDVRRQLARTGEHPGVAFDDLPVFGTVASRFNDDGVTALYQHLRHLLAERGLPVAAGLLPPIMTHTSSRTEAIVPAARIRYLAEIAGTVRGYHARTEELAAQAHRRQQLHEVAELLAGDGHPTTEVDKLAQRVDDELDRDAQHLLDGWPGRVSDYAAVEPRRSLSGTDVPRIALPRWHDHGDLLRWLRAENLPGHFPFTAGVFPFKRDGEDPARMFAGEGDPFRTNRRFKLLAQGQPSTRLSTAFDSVTLYGFDPDERPDIYGKVGNSGVSIATLDDMRRSMTASTSAIRPRRCP